MLKISYLVAHIINISSHKLILFLITLELACLNFIRIYCQLTHGVLFSVQTLACVVARNIFWWVCVCVSRERERESFGCQNGEWGWRKHQWLWRKLRMHGAKTQEHKIICSELILSSSSVLLNHEKRNNESAQSQFRLRHQYQAISSMWGASDKHLNLYFIYSSS